MGSSPRPSGATAADARSRLIHREVVQLAILITAAVGAFFLTRVIAASNRDMNLHDAAEWYARGRQHLGTGEVDGAIDAFRRAAVKDRSDKRYVLALADALARTRQYDAARSALLALRESAPEDSTVNLQLARLAADRQDVTEASRYYHNALYAPWRPDQADERRGVRLELVRFLMTQGQTARAVAELEALSADLPDDAASHTMIGQLFVNAGDVAHALDQFQRALRIAPDDGAALAGAGQAAFRLGDYTRARKYLHDAPDEIPGTTDARHIVDLTMSADPLASRIGPAARRQRLGGTIVFALERLATCSGRPPAQPDAEAEALRSEAETFAAQMKRSHSLEADTIEAGLELADRIEQHVIARCPPATPRDRAVLLIAQMHGVGQR